MMKNGVSFNCDSTLGYRLILDLCKLEGLSRHIVDKKLGKITKNGISLKTFPA